MRAHAQIFAYALPLSVWACCDPKPITVRDHIGFVAPLAMVVAEPPKPAPPAPADGCSRELRALSLCDYRNSVQVE